MKNETRTRSFLLLAFLLIGIGGYCQTDYQFWFAAPEVSYAVTYPHIYDTVGIDRPIVLVISTCEGPAIVRISEPANPNFQEIIDTLPNEVIHQLNLTAFINQIETKPANTVLSYGLLITSTKPINAVYEVQNRINSESYSLKGMNALGNEFIIPAQTQYSNYPYCDPPARNSFAIVATEDNSTVKIVPSQLMEGQTGLDTIFVVLNRGQSWGGRAVSADSSLHLGGSFVLSDKPIAVTVTDDAVRPTDAIGLSIDIAGDQLVPRSLMTNEYLAFPVDYWYGYQSMLYIYAFEDSTSVTIDGNGAGIINRGGVIRHEIGTSSTNPAYIQSNKPVEVYMFYKDQQGGIPKYNEVAGEICAPLSCAGSYHVCFRLTGPYLLGDQNSYRLLCRTVDCANFTCSDPNIQALLTPGAFIPIPSTGNTWGYYFWGAPWEQLTFSNSTGNFQASTANELIHAALRMNTYTAYSGLNLGPDRVLCPGDTILLDAGYGNYQYLWSTNATTRTITVTTPGTYWVRKTSINCTLSDTIVISNLNYTPVNLGPDTSLCNGDSLLLDGGAGKSWYLWSTHQTTQKIYVHDSGTYWVKVPVSPCKLTDSDTIHVSRISSIELGPDRTICSGDSVMLDAGSGMSSYIWNTGATTQKIWAKNLGQYKVTVGHGRCHFSDSLMVSLNPVPIVNLGADTNICSGQTKTFDAGYCTGCTYSWDNISAGLTNICTNQTYTTGQAGIYRVTVTSANGCHNRDTVQLFTNAGVPVTINITSSLINVCQGSPVTYYAHTTNGGVMPTFQWKVNGIVLGTNDSLFTYVPSNNDMVSCIITSSETCTTNNPASSIPYPISVSPLLPVSITISTFQNPFCLGSPVTFNATPGNEGALPVYQWQVNGMSVGPNSSTYTYNPVNGDLVSCVLTSSATCTSGNPASSNSITMNAISGIAAGVTIGASSNPFCPGSSVTFTAHPTNGGAAPVYSWKLNGANVGTNSTTYSYFPANGDSIRCVMTSNMACVTGNPASSAEIIMSGTLASVVTFTSCFDTLTTINAKPIRLKGGIPLGGIYSGPGVNSGTGIFDPSAAGVGTHTIFYSYTNANSCSATATRQIVTRDALRVTCGDQIIDIRDNKVYPTIQIGSQCWLAKNLNYGTVLGASQDQRDDCVAEKYCYQDNPINCGTQGGLYQWDKLMQFDNTPADQGLCPPAWHIPTENDWNILFANYINNGFAGSPLKYSGFSGFNALLYGARHINSGWDFNGFATFFWSSTSYGGYKAWAHGMNESDPSVSIYPASRVNAFSVRCVED